MTIDKQKYNLKSLKVGDEIIYDQKIELVRTAACKCKSGIFLVSRKGTGSKVIRVR